MNFISDGLWACLGALIGGAIGSITTYIVSNKSIKLELKKINISFQMDKLSKLESIKKNYNIDYTNKIDSENYHIIIKDFEYLSIVFNNSSHYLINHNQFNEVANEFKNNKLEYENKDANNELRNIYFYKDFNLKMDKMIKEEMIKTNHIIEKIFK